MVAGNTLVQAVVDEDLMPGVVGAAHGQMAIAQLVDSYRVGWERNGRGIAAPIALGLQGLLGLRLVPLPHAERYERR